MALPGLDAAVAALNIKADEGDFLVLGMTGHEHLGRMFEYVVEVAEIPAGLLDLLGEAKKVDLGKLIGTPATVHMKVLEEDRYFHGHVTRAKHGPKRGRYETYTLTLQPWIWFMTQTRNSRVFQEKSVKDVLTELMKDYNSPSEWKLVSDYPKLDYCVQYDETDFDFFSRLLEEFGIYYFFEHEDKKHTLVLTDSTANHKPRKGDTAINWANAMLSTSTITTWYVQQEVRSVKTLLTEYDYLAPTEEIKGEGNAEKKPKMLGNMEWFEHPARVVQNGVKPEAQSAKTLVTQQAKVRMEELLSLYASATGQTNVRDLGVGMTFDIDGVDDKGAYLMVSAIYRLDFPDHEAIEDLKSSRKHEGYLCDFLAISKDAKYRSPRTTPRPVIAGPQTAMVVGASSNEIETDKHGRIKIHFHWDRLGKKDQTASCWVRVAQPWAGKKFGAWSLPRVGQEVVVQFLDGNPDRPLVTGSVYNNDDMVAWTLPAQKTVTGFKSRTTEKGDEDTANELRFDDKKDHEYIWFHAERDFRRQVEHDAFDWVGNNESVKVTLTRKEAIGENWFVDVTKDVMHNIGKDLHVNVAGDIFYTGDATFQLQLTKDFNAKIDGDLGAEVGGKTQIKSTGDITIESTGKITLKGASVVIDGSGGVDITGAMVKVNCGGSGSPAKPAKPTEAKKEDSITPEKATDYKKTFDDPMDKTEGGTGSSNSKSS